MPLAGGRNGAVVVDLAGARRRAGDGQAAGRADLDAAAGGVRARRRSALFSSTIVLVSERLPLT